MSDLAWMKWIRACHRDPKTRVQFPDCGKQSPFAPLTGQDSRVLSAIAACWQLYSSGDAAAERAALESVRNLLPAMQPKCWWIARELIAMVMDWDDREKLWNLVSKPRVSSSISIDGTELSGALDRLRMGCPHFDESGSAYLDALKDVEHEVLSARKVAADDAAFESDVQAR
jgi:hypothetical protein